MNKIASPTIEKSDALRTPWGNGNADADPKVIAQQIVEAMEAKDATLVYGFRHDTREAHALRVAAAVAEQHTALRAKYGNSECLPDPNVVFEAALRPF